MGKKIRLIDVGIGKVLGVCATWHKIHYNYGDNIKLATNIRRKINDYLGVNNPNIWMATD